MNFSKISKVLISYFVGSSLCFVGATESKVNDQENSTEIQVVTKDSSSEKVSSESKSEEKIDNSKLVKIGDVSVNSSEANFEVLRKKNGELEIRDYVDSKNDDSDILSKAHIYMRSSMVSFYYSPDGNIVCESQDSEGVSPSEKV